MARDGRWTPVRISADELNAVLAQARAEQWQELALRGRDDIEPYRPDHEPHEFYLRDRISTLDSSRVLELNRLTFLDLSGNALDDEGARALAALKGLTSSICGTTRSEATAHGGRAYSDDPPRSGRQPDRVTL